MILENSQLEAGSLAEALDEESAKVGRLEAEVIVLKKDIISLKFTTGKKTQ